MTEQSSNGPCFDESPFFEGISSNGLLCELPAEHSGDHRAGDATWGTRSVEPQPVTDAQVLAALNAYWQYDPPITDPAYWSEEHKGIMRAALEAAQEAGR